MSEEIRWLQDWDPALALAKDQDKCVFLDFFHPE